MFAKFAMVLLLSTVVLIPRCYQPIPQDAKKPATRKTPRLDTKEAAWSLATMDNWVREVKVETMESAPPQFAVNLSLWMPSPGWKLEVDNVERQRDGRVLIKVTGQRPKGMLPAVMSKKVLRIVLGSLPKGEYLLDVWGRLDKSKEHRRKGIALLRAKGL